MNLKGMVEKSPALMVLGCLFTGFMGGVGVMEYLDSRDDKLREEIIAQIKSENSALKASNEKLDSTIKELVIKHINQQAIIDGKPLSGDNSAIRKAVKDLDFAEISKVVSDPKKSIKDLVIKW